MYTAFTSRFRRTKKRSISTFQDPEGPFRMGTAARKKYSQKISSKLGSPVPTPKGESKRRA
jgi:hypothetical protein